MKVMPMPAPAILAVPSNSGPGRHPDRGFSGLVARASSAPVRGAAAEKGFDSYDCLSKWREIAFNRRQFLDDIAEYIGWIKEGPSKLFGQLGGYTQIADRRELIKKFRETCGNQMNDYQAREVAAASEEVDQAERDLEEAVEEGLARQNIAMPRNLGEALRLFERIILEDLRVVP